MNPRIITASYLRSLVAVLVLYGLLFSGVCLLIAVIPVQYSGNYEWQAEQALQRGELATAENFVRSRLRKEYYDFTAQRLLAKILIQGDKTAEAVILLEESLRKEESVLQKTVYHYGYDSYATRELLSSALLKTGRNKEAEEMSRQARNAYASGGRGIARNLVVF